jgi:hypothetical protein
VTDLCPASSSRWQRRQYAFSKHPPGGRGSVSGKTTEDTVLPLR